MASGHIDISSKTVMYLKLIICCYIPLLMFVLPFDVSKKGDENTKLLESHVMLKVI